ncbi:glycosyltransferase family 4 protein [Demequina rhizosphaerae]|uniref:glycosyltransferase family 4 protein n=1 Tax=Demequina rhizosphaerae TaxID=1638985 RepID=UPI0009E18CFB|nr:glycosyltransferase family 4 protein [Demequina rhizosphaerae]
MGTDDAADVTIVSAHYAPEPTGNAPYSTSLARELARRGRRVDAIAAQPFYPGWRIYEGYGAWTSREDDAGVELTRRRHYVPGRPTAIRRLLSETSFGLRVALTRWRPAKVRVLVSPALFGTAVVLARAVVLDRGTPIVVWIQDLYGTGMRETGAGGGAAARIVSAVEGWVLRRATRVVVIHDRFAAAIERDYGVDPARIDVVRNWTHLDESVVPDRAAARATLGWGDGDVVAVHAGNMGVKQGLDTVVAAAARAEALGSRVRFVMVGDGSERARLEEAAAGLSTIEFIGTLGDDEFRAALHAADVLVVNELPGVAEMSVPSKLTSYFATGRPVVAAVDPHGATADEIAGSGGGLVVPSGDPDALVEAIETLGGDAVLAHRLGESGLRFRREVLSLDAAVTRFEEALARAGAPLGAEAEDGAPMRAGRAV